MAKYTDRYWWSNDGLRLHYRDYAGGDDGRPPIICIPGLTRNARDFEVVANHVAGGWRVICLDLRGRGESAYAKDSMTYTPLVYLQDIEALVNETGISRFVSLGTSLGGILTMLFAATGAQRLAGAMLNDIGPVIEPGGLDRIKNYVGKPVSWPTWLHCARHYAEGIGDIYPDYSIDQWLGFAKRVCKVTNNGRIVQDYDLRIIDPFKTPGGEAGFDMWPAFDALKPVPTLVLRGELSDLFSPATLAEMGTRLPDIETVTVPRVGHAPCLDEPESLAGIDRLLERVLRQG